MSKIGRIPINIPDGANIEISGADFKVTGPKGEQALTLPRNIKVEKNDNILSVTRANNDKETRALHGLFRVLIFNTIQGVTTGWERKLDFKGVGFRAEVQGEKLVMNLGFSHPAEFQAPEGITFEVVKNIITVSGIDKQKVGQAAANIRAVKPVEPYKGKGIKYIDEIIRRKAGKTATKGE